MPVSTKIAEFIEKSSWIRKMFEDGARLKQEYGAQNVFDFSLGNPNLDPKSRDEECHSGSGKGLGSRNPRVHGQRGVPRLSALA